MTIKNRKNIFAIGVLVIFLAVIFAVVPMLLQRHKDKKVTQSLIVLAQAKTPSEKKEAARNYLLATAQPVISASQSHADGKDNPNYMCAFAKKIVDYWEQMANTEQVVWVDGTTYGVDYEGWVETAQVYNEVYQAYGESCLGWPLDI